MTEISQEGTTDTAPTVNLKELFLCPKHGMLEPSRFNADWTTDYACPVNGCEEDMQSVDLTPVLWTQEKKAQVLAGVKERLEPLLDEYRQALEAFCRQEPGSGLRFREIEGRLLATLNPSEGEDR